MRARTSTRVTMQPLEFRSRSLRQLSCFVQSILSLSIVLCPTCHNCQ